MENISWTTFGIATTLFLLCYYLIILIYCYGHELSAIIPKGSDDNYNLLFIDENQESDEIAFEAKAWQEPV